MFTVIISVASVCALLITVRIQCKIFQNQSRPCLLCTKLHYNHQRKSLNKYRKNEFANKLCSLECYDQWIKGDMEKEYFKGKYLKFEKVITKQTNSYIGTYKDGKINIIKIEKKEWSNNEEK